MTHKNMFIVSILTYTFLSVLSQYGSAHTIDMSWLLAGAFIPLSCFTIIPLLDCSRSFSQGCSERAKVPFKVSFSLLVVSPLIIAFICAMFAGLPISIFWGALFATGIGGLVDVTTFRWMRKFSSKDEVRMSVSNLLATVSGSFIFFMIAFTPLLPEVFGVGNILNKGNYTDPAISSMLQATVIYTAGMLIAHGSALVRNMRKLKTKAPKQACLCKSCK